MAGSEVAHLLASLDRLRATFAWKTRGLDADGLSFRFPSSELSLGRLLKHLARAEDEMFASKLWGEPVPEPWASAPWDDDPEWDFTSADADPPEVLYALWSDTVTRSRASVERALADGGLDHQAHLGWGGQHASLRRLLFDLIEVCAGLLDGNDPATCATREAEEELGFRLSNLRFMTTVYMTPGAVTERLSLFIADYDHEARIGTGGGVTHEGEDIEVLELSIDEAMAMISDGRIRDAKTIMLLQHLALTVFRS